MGILDIVIVVILGLSVILGAVFGFLGKFSKFVSLILGIAASYFITNPINNVIVEKGYYVQLGTSWNIDPQYIGIGGLILLYIVIFIIVFIILRILFKVFTGLIEKIPFFKVTDHIVGAAVGVLNGFFLICLIFLVIGMISNSNEGIKTWVDNDLNSQTGFAKLVFDFAAKVTQNIKA